MDGLYRTSYGRAPRFTEFMPDTATVARDGRRQQRLAGTVAGEQTGFHQCLGAASDFVAAYEVSRLKATWIR